MDKFPISTNADATNEGPAWRNKNVWLLLIAPAILVALSGIAVGGLAWYLGTHNAG